MYLEKEFSFGQVFVDVKRNLIFVDRGEGKEIWQCCFEKERKALFDWLFTEPELDRDDANQIAWQYGICDCGAEEEGEGMEVLKITSPRIKDRIILELLSSKRTYELRKVEKLGIFLVNPEEMVYLLGSEPGWVQWEKDKGWVRKKEFDKVDEYFVKHIITGNSERYFDKMSGKI